MLNSNIEILSPAMEKNNQRDDCFCGSSCTWLWGENYPSPRSSVLCEVAPTWQQKARKCMIPCPTVVKAGRTRESVKDTKERFKAQRTSVILAEQLNKRGVPPVVAGNTPSAISKLRQPPSWNVLLPFHPNPRGSEQGGRMERCQQCLSWREQHASTSGYQAAAAPCSYESLGWKQKKLSLNNSPIFTGYAIQVTNILKPQFLIYQLRIIIHLSHRVQMKLNEAIHAKNSVTKLAANKH